jgi:hypothetical protein
MGDAGQNSAERSLVKKPEREGDRLSQVARKRIEEAGRWTKEVGFVAQTKLNGVNRVEWMFVVKAAAYNLVRLPRLLATGKVYPDSAQSRIGGFGHRENG